MDVIRKAHLKRDANSTLLEPAKLAVKPTPNAAKIAAYLTDPSPATRLVAVFALRHIGTPEALQHLLTGLEHTDKLVRANTIRALAKLGRGNPDVVNRTHA